MQVKIRDVNEAEAIAFTDIHFSELTQLIEFINQSSGFYYKGGNAPFHSYQLVLEAGEAFCEIIIGEDE